jgi:hypothetical protein
MKPETGAPVKPWMKPDGTPGAILTAMGQVAQSVGAIAKDRSAAELKYKFRSIDDLLIRLQPALIEHGVAVVFSVVANRTDTRPGKSGGTITVVQLKVAVDYVHVDGTYVTTVAEGEGADYGDKALNKALTGAMKNAHLHTFSVPTGTKRDSEFEAGPKPPKMSPEARSVVDRLNKLQTSDEVAGFMRALRDDPAVVDTLEAEVDVVREIAKARYRKLEATERKTRKTSHSPKSGPPPDDNLTW